MITESQVVASEEIDSIHFLNSFCHTYAPSMCLMPPLYQLTDLHERIQKGHI
jgi:dimeric dUTPase (all-alpha-NTP-PPase superfamily)